MSIKPIETSYKGYRFRSRLEARWAVYFDALGCDWEYEPQGFDLGNGILYLPDFRVGWRAGSEAHMYWAEVKPDTGEDLPPDDLRKIHAFVSGVAPLILLVGTPAPVTYPYLESPGADGSPGVSESNIILGQHKGRGRFFLNPGLPTGTALHAPGWQWDDAFAAVAAARSARFEHGETPR